MSNFQARPDIEAFRVYKAMHLATFLSEIELIVKAHDWRMFRSYFTYTKTPEERALKSILWCRFILPQYFRDPSPDFQYELAFLFWTEGNEYVACPRGFGKTSTVQGLIAFSIAHKIDNFIVLIEKTHTEASEVLSAVRAEFVENEVLKAIYGNVIGRDKMGAAPEKVKDAEGDMFLNGIRLRAKGFDTPIRGLKSREWRPDRVVCDDVESDEHIRSEDQRRKYKENYTQGIIPAIDIGGKVKVFGTILMGGSLLDDLINTHSGMVYAAFNPSLNIESDRDLIEKSLLWPERWSYDLLKQKYDEMKMEGLGNNKFSQEFLNQALAEESRPFKWEWLQKTFSERDVQYKTFNRCAVIDTAESKNQGADDSFLTVVDWDVENNWFIQEARGRKVNAPELIDWIFEIWETWKPQKIGIEKKAFEDQVKPYLRLKSEQLGVYPIVVELEHGGRRKEDRVVGALQGRFESGKIYFKEAPTDDTPRLRGQLHDFPKGRNDDGPDSLAYHASIGSRPFSKAKEVMTGTEREFYEYRKQQKSFNKQSIVNKL